MRDDVALSRVGMDNPECQRQDPGVTTFAESCGQQAPRSLWFERLRSWAAPRSVDEWLVEEANVRGYWGASGRDVPQRSRDERLTDEELIVGLLAPRATVDGRVFKLIVRMLQSENISEEKLRFHSRRERADGPLYWLACQVPAAELTPVIRSLASRPPRGYHPLRHRYDPGRLVRRPATKAALWRTPRS